MNDGGTEGQYRTYSGLIVDNAAWCQVIFSEKDRSWDKKERNGKDQKEGTGKQTR